MLMNSVTTEALAPNRIKQQPPISLYRKVSFSNLLLGFSIFILAVLVIFAIVPQWVAPYSPTDMLTDELLKAPSFSHILGTDQFGRDVWSLIVYGSRQSLMIGVISVLIGGLIGTAIGLVAGYFGGVVDSVFMRINDVMMTIPGILFAIVIAVVLGPSFLM